MRNQRLIGHSPIKKRKKKKKEMVVRAGEPMGEHIPFGRDISKVRI
jgi:hypothetical protein